MNNWNLKIGMIGLGYWGKNLLRNLHELGFLSMACDKSIEIINERKKEYPNIQFTTNHDEILSNPDIDAVVIASPAATHYELAKKALLAGKDVFVEKPLSLRMEEGEDLVKIASENDRILMVGHILQYHTAVIKLKELIEKGDIGKVQYIYSNRLNIGKLRTEENILWSFAPHDISVMLMLAGQSPEKIDGFGESYLNKDIYDVTVTHFQFKSGIKGHIFVSWLHPFKEQKLVVVGSQAMVVFDDLTEDKLFIYPHKIEWQEGRIPVAHKADHFTIEIDKKEPLKEEMLHFAECVKFRKRPKTDGEEGLRVLQVLEEIEKRIKSGM